MGSFKDKILFIVRPNVQNINSLLLDDVLSTKRHFRILDKTNRTSTVDLSQTLSQRLNHSF